MEPTVKDSFDKICLPFPCLVALVFRSFLLVIMFMSSTNLEEGRLGVMN